MRAKMIESFKQVQGTTHCPFAKKARIVEISPNLESVSEISISLAMALPQLTTNLVDAVLVYLPNEFTETIDSVGSALYQILIMLDETCLIGAGSKDWKLYLQSEKFFVATFWEGFGETNPRKCNKGAFLLFQPKSSFERGGFRGDHKEHGLRMTIRRLFERSGEPYNHEPLTESERFLPGVTWWK